MAEHEAGHAALAEEEGIQGFAVFVRRWDRRGGGGGGRGGGVAWGESTGGEVQIEKVFAVGGAAGEAGAAGGAGGEGENDGVAGGEGRYVGADAFY